MRVLVFIKYIFFLYPGILLAQGGEDIARSQVFEYEKVRSDLTVKLKEAKSVNKVEDQSSVLFEMGELDVSMGNLTALEEVLDEMSQLYAQTRNLTVKSHLVRLESEFFRLKGLYRHALESFKSYVLLQDSLKDIATQLKIDALNDQSKQRENEIRLEQTANLQRLIYALGALLLVSLGFLTYGMYKRRKVEGLNIHLATLMSEYVGSYSSKLVDPEFKRKVITEVKEDENLKVEGLTDEMVDKILDKLKKFEEDKFYLQENITINELAECLNTNKTYLSKVINVVKKKPFNNYVNELRLVHAIQLLKSGEHKRYTMKAISKEAGFKSKSTFNIAFKEYTGMTPSEFVKSIQKENNQK